VAARQAYGLQTGRGLHGLQFESGFLSSGIFLRLEVLANTDGVQKTSDPPRHHTVAVFKPTDNKRIMVFHI